MATVEERLEALETRILRLEQILPKHLKRPPKADAGAAAPTASNAARANAAPSPGLISERVLARVGDSAPRREPSDPVTVTRILGWSGAAALVLAAVYFIRLAVDEGWLTPVRQVGLAAMGGITLICVGMLLRGAARKYASFLPAAGVVVLFATVFGAHLYYGLIAAPFAIACVVGICLMTLWLGGLFHNDLYALFAVVGAYATPFMMSSWLVNLDDLLIYYSAWSVLFCAYAVWQGGRYTYLAAMYLALIGFDIAWRLFARTQWETAAVYQALQFLVFLATVVVYGIRHRSPLSDAMALAHGFGLLLFYGVEYVILARYLPEWAPWVALASAAVLVVAYRLARSSLGEELEAGATLISAYVALVLFHAVYLDLIPGEWRPWIALGVLPGLAAYGVRYAASKRVALPIVAALALIFVLNFLKIIAHVGVDDVPGAMLLIVLFAVALYAGYILISSDSPMAWLRLGLLYAGHVAAMVAALRFLGTSLMVSFFWAGIAIGSLFLALAYRDRVLGQSSLLVFAVSGMKVLIYDLAGSPAPIRIGTLLVLGVTLYLGGWLYQKLSTDTLGGSETAPSRAG